MGVLFGVICERTYTKVVCVLTKSIKNFGPYGKKLHHIFTLLTEHVYIITERFWNFYSKMKSSVKNVLFIWTLLFGDICDRTYKFVICEFTHASQ